MALYDGDLVTMTTPDGRTVTMPSGLASNFPGLQPVPPPAPAPAPPDSSASASPPAPAVVSPPAESAPSPGQGPVTDPSQLPPPTGAPSVPRGPVTSPAEDTGPPQRPAPEPPPTKAQLIKEGPAGTLAAQYAAIDKQQGAIERSAQVEADTATQQGQVLAARDARTQQILEERAKQAAQNEAELNARIQQRDQMADQIAKTRVDRTVDHPIWAQIGLILSTIGTAMTRRPGEAWNDPAYNTLTQMLDRKVNGQIQDLEQKRLGLAQMNVGVAEQRQHNVDRLTEIDARRDAALQQAQQAVQTIATTMKAPSAIAGAQQLVAKLEEDRANLRGQAADRYQAQLNTERAQAQQVQMHRESLGMQYRIHRETMDANEREKMAAIAAQLLKEGKAEAAAKAKAVAEGGLFDPRTRDPLMDPAGQAKFKQADQLEAAARQQRDPALARRQQQQADDLRMSARINDAIILDPKIAGPIRDKIGTAQEVTDQIGDLVAKLEQNPSAFNREQWAGIATQMGDLANKYQRTIGEKISVRAFEQTMKHILEFDPDSYFHRVANQERALESLKQLKSIVANDVNNALGKDGVKADWRPLARGEEAGAAAFNADEKTAIELGQAENPSFLQRVGARILSAGFKGYDDYGFQEQAEQAARARPGSEAGLSPNATTHVKALATRALAAGNAEHDRIVLALANPISAGLSEGGRSSLALGMLEVLRNSAPPVYDDVVKALPPSDQEAIRGIDASIRKAPNVPRVPSHYNPDAAEAADEAERRAAAFAPFQPGAKLTNSPGAGTPR